MTPEFKLRIHSGIIIALSALILLIFSPRWLVALALGVILSITLRFEWPRFNLPHLTIFYPVMPFVLLIALTLSPYHALVPFLIITVWAHDTGAYFFGKVWGRYKLWSTISPGKTWEGAVGGYLGAIIATLIYDTFIGTNASAPFIMMVSALICASATAGDLFESYLKRRAGLKDSGTLLPGHGGFLDRFDGIMGAILIVYPLRKWLSTWLYL